MGLSSERLLTGTMRRNRSVRDRDRRRVIRRAGFVLVAVAALFGSLLVLRPAPSAGQRFEVHATPRWQPKRVEPAALAADASMPTPFSVESGQTLSGLLSELDVPTREHAAAVEALSEFVDIRRLRPGTSGLAYRDAHGQLSHVRMRLRNGWVELANAANDWQAKFRSFARRIALARSAGTVNGPLEQAVRMSGASAEITYKMADVLQWDLDFNRDLRLGDRFEVLYEQVYLDDSNVGSGSVMALSYKNRGQRYEAYRFEDAYYDGEGRPLQKMFLRSPLPFSRVTSRFSRRRFHPVLKVHRPHWGVDYGAPTGTPVRATAGGHVAFAGRKGGAGNMVEIRHVGGYRTAYLHLSRFAKGVRSGSRVAQGDIIGYVGSTGLSTGPHLDYRVKKDGRWIDPLSIHLRPAPPIPDDRMPAFRAQRDALRQELLARAERDPTVRVPDAAQLTAALELPSSASRERAR